MLAIKYLEKILGIHLPTHGLLPIIKHGLPENPIFKKKKFSNKNLRLGISQPCLMKPQGTYRCFMLFPGCFWAGPVGIIVPWDAIRSLHPPKPPRFALPHLPSPARCATDRYLRLSPGTIAGDPPYVNRLRLYDQSQTTYISLFYYSSDAQTRGKVNQSDLLGLYNVLCNAWVMQ